MKNEEPILMPSKNLIDAYTHFLTSAVKKASVVEDKSAKALHHLIDEASEEFDEVVDITREEAEDVARYIKRDLKDAAAYMEETGHSFFQWLSMDTIDAAIIEDYIIDAFKKAADQTTVELNKLKMSTEAGKYHTGEIAGPGILICDRCGERTHMIKPDNIKPCTSCQGEKYHRITQYDRIRK